MMMMMMMVVVVVSINIYYIKFLMESLNLNFLKQPSASFTDMEFESYNS